MEVESETPEVTEEQKAPAAEEEAPAVSTNGEAVGQSSEAKTSPEESSQEEIKEVPADDVLMEPPAAKPALSQNTDTSLDHEDEVQVLSSQEAEKPQNAVAETPEEPVDSEVVSSTATEEVEQPATESSEEPATVELEVECANIYEGLDDDINEENLDATSQEIMDHLTAEAVQSDRSDIVSPSSSVS